MNCDQLTIKVFTDGQLFDTPLEVDVAPIATIEGSTKRIATATKPFEFNLSAKHGLRTEDISVDIVSADGTKLSPPEICDNQNGTFTVSFVPLDPGDLQVHVSTKSVLYDTPLELHVRPTAKFLGGGRRLATATKVFDFVLGAEHLKVEDVKVDVLDENGEKIQPDITDNSDGTFTVSFTPNKHGLLSVSVYAHGEPIGTPMEVEVAPIARILGETNRVGHSTKPFEFKLDAPNLTPDMVSVNIKNEKGYSLPTPTIIDNLDGTFTVQFVPNDPSQLEITISTNGELYDVPLHVNVLPTAKLASPAVLPARCTKPVNLKLRVEPGLTVEDVVVDLKYKDTGKKLEAEVTDKGNGTFTVSFVPPDEGELEVNIDAHGDPIGETSRIIVAAAPYAKFPPGPPQRQATQTKPFTFPLQTTSLFPNEVKVKLGDEEVDIKVDDLRDGNFNISFIPNKVGSFPVEVFYDGKPVDGEPFSINVDPKPEVLGISKLEGAVVSKPFDIILKTVNLRPDQVIVNLRDSKNKPITNFKLKPNGKDSMVVSFVPSVPGEHTFDLVADGKPVNGLPKDFPVAPKPAATLVGDPKRKGVEGKLFDFKLNTVNLRPEDIRIEVTDSEGNKIWREDAKITDEADKAVVEGKPLVEPSIKVDTKSSELVRKPVEKVRSLRSKMSERKPSSKGKEKDDDKGKGKAKESATLIPTSSSNLARPKLVNTAGLKGIMVPGEIIISPPHLLVKNDEFTISFVPWKEGKFDVKVILEDSVVELEVMADPKPRSKTVETLDQMGIGPGFQSIGDEKELLKRIKELRENLIKGYQRNNQLAESHKEVEKTISLLVRNQTSIVAIDRARKKRQQGNVAQVGESQTTFHRNRQKLALYGNLFYLLRSEPHYLATLVNLVDPKHRKDMSQLIILTLFTNAFSPSQELMLLRLISTSVSYDIVSYASAQKFLESNSASIDLIISYNRRKEGRKFIKKIFSKPLQDFMEETQIDKDIPALSKWVEQFYEIISSSIDQLPYGIRYICQVIYNTLQTQFPQTKPDTLLSAVGYVVFYRFINLSFVNPSEWGLIDGDLDPTHPLTFNSLAISKILKSLFTDLKEISDPVLQPLNPWIKSKLPEVQIFLRDIIDVSDPEEHLKVSKYSKLGSAIDESVLVSLKEIVLLHAECDKHKKELIKKDVDPNEDQLQQILKELEEVPSDGANDKKQINLPLHNKFEINMSKVEREYNLKLDTINEMLYLFQEFPATNGDTLLEMFLIMKHKASVQTPTKSENVEKIDSVLRNLETLSNAKDSNLKRSNGYNDFIDEIREELAAKDKYVKQLRGEIKQLTEAIEELDGQKKKLSEATKAYEDYLQGVRNELKKNFKPTTKKFSWKELTNKKCNIIESSSLPDSQRKAIKFEITHSGPEEFKVKGKVAMVSKDFKIKMTDLLDAKDRGETTFDTEAGVILWINATLEFLNGRFLNTKRKYAKAK
eukprot:TRINITY_DN8933_c0_g1_i8.p1 TRINITY_DN8933_c0_g1~~TRINITY_DN8933_c0_g1_i8.p1  ORF type:complete len:1570 (-),score=427.24 TRINITY_DN8933_c0_g1_i8:62-4453(-)